MSSSESRKKAARRRNMPRAPGGKGTLIIIGGHEDHEGKQEILKAVAAHIKSGKLLLATIASHEPHGYLARYRKAFAAFGIDDVNEIYIEDRADALKPEKLKAFEGIDGIFFSGGDQLRITSQVGDTPIFDSIHDIHRRGGVIAGTSAGASVMSETMLVGGKSSSSFRLGDLHMAPGLGLIRNVIIDQHFAERGRIGRLLGAVAQNPRMLGIGIDEDTAIIVEGTNFQVIGTGAVYVVDGARTTYSNISEGDPETILSMHNLTLHVLSAGDEFDLQGRIPVAHEIEPEEESGEKQ